MQPEQLLIAPEGGVLDVLSVCSQPLVSVIREYRRRVIELPENAEIANSKPSFNLTSDFFSNGSAGADSFGLASTLMINHQIPLAANFTNLYAHIDRR